MSPPPPPKLPGTPPRSTSGTHQIPFCVFFFLRVGVSPSYSPSFRSRAKTAIQTARYKLVFWPLARHRKRNRSGNRESASALHLHWKRNIFGVMSSTTRGSVKMVEQWHIFRWIFGPKSVGFRLVVRCGKPHFLRRCRWAPRPGPVNSFCLWPL